MNEEIGEELKDIDLEEDLLLEIEQNKEEKTIDAKLVQQNQKSIYNINSKNKWGICFSCEIPDPDKKDNVIKVLFSCYHVIKDLNEISISSHQKEEIKINLKDGRRRCWLDKEMDYVCIEILEEDNISNYLSVFNDINDEKYQNEYIEKKILYASNTKKISAGEGKLTPLYLIYHFYTVEGWSGSPVFLNGDNKVIGIHMGGIDKNKDNKIIKKEKAVNIGIPIKNVLMHMEKLGKGNLE